MGEERNEVMLQHHDVQLKEIKADVRTVNSTVNAIQLSNVATNAEVKQIKSDVGDVLEGQKTGRKWIYVYLATNIITMLWVVFAYAIRKGLI